MERFSAIAVGILSWFEGSAHNRRGNIMKILTAAAVAILLSSGMAFAQDNTQTGSTTQQGSGTDAANYLAGPNIHRFYTDESMGTLRPEADIKTTYEAMSPEEQANLKQACSGNKDNRWSTLCNSIGSM
jgi:hypothetical protein